MHDENIRNLSYKELWRLESKRTAEKRKCSCGCSRLFEGDYAVCKNCGELIFKDDSARFRYKMKQARIKERRNNK